ncbi:hypothetical protein J6590_013580 [Homalodisca vitripennis]|nr:hypothetical protein J6590_013580 [Homalodisca vitripennis]
MVRAREGEMKRKNSSPTAKLENRTGKRLSCGDWRREVSRPNSRRIALHIMGIAGATLGLSTSSYDESEESISHGDYYWRGVLLGSGSVKYIQ